MKAVLSRSRFIAVLLLMLLLSGILQTYPLGRYMGRAVPYSAKPHPGHEIVPLTQGDHLQLIYHFWLFKDAVEHGRPFFPEPLEFRVEDPARTFSTQFFPLSFGYWIFSPLGQAAAYNMLVLLSYVFSGLAGYLLSSIFFSPGASLIGALTFALFPFRYAQLMGGHSNGFVSFLAPLSLALLIIAFRSRRPSAAWASGASFLFLCSTDLTAAYFTSFFYFPVLLLLVLASDDRPPKAVSPSRSRIAQRFPPLPAGPLIPFLSGSSAGIAYFFFRLRYSVSSSWSAVDCLSVPFHGLLGVLAWLVLSAVIKSLFSLPRPSSRRAALAILSPLFLLLLYPIALIFPVPHWGRTLAALSGFAALSLSVFLILRAGLPSPRAGPMMRVVRKRASIVLPLLIFSLLAFSLVLFERNTRISGSSIGSGRSYQEVKIYSPGVQAFLSKDYGDAEKALYPGLSVIALSILALLTAWRRKAREGGAWDILLLFFVWGGLLAALLALGPRGESISMLFPLLRKAIPLYDLSRAPSRIYLLTAIALSLGATAGTASLLRFAREGRGKFLVVLIVSAILICDLLPPVSPGLSHLPGENRIYARAAAERNGGRLMDVPIWPGDSAWSSLYLYYAALYRTPTINGYSPMVPGGYFTSVFTPLEDVNLGEIRREQYRLLRELAVSFIVFHEEAFPPQVSPFPFQFSLDNLRDSPFLEFVDRDGPHWLFRLKRAPGEIFPSFDTTSIMGKVFEAEHHFLPPGVVRADPAASGGSLAEFSAGPPRGINLPFPLKGSYPTGTYRCGALFLGQDGPIAAGLVLKVRNRLSGDLVAFSSQTSAEEVSPSGAHLVFLDTTFTLDRPAPLSFEIVTDGLGAFAWDFLYLRHEKEIDPRRIFEAEDLVHMGLTIELPEAGGGEAVQLLPGRDPADFVLLGPDRLVPGGLYRAGLQLHTDARAGNQGRFEVRLSNADGHLSRKTIDAAAAVKGKLEVALEFELLRTVPVSFRVFYEQGAELLLDRIVLTRLSAE